MRRRWGGGEVLWSRCVLCGGREGWSANRNITETQCRCGLSFAVPQPSPPPSPPPPPPPPLLLPPPPPLLLPPPPHFIHSFVAVATTKAIERAVAGSAALLQQRSPNPVLSLDFSNESPWSPSIVKHRECPKTTNTITSSRCTRKPFP